uniref:RNA helicase n=1 Tax=Chromera velia CCMP2878 TaxID=1169474 RepID=A0A0G4FVL4_9ALVE|mmetsp:Transcript_49174/g.96948  ORF Transcript_49174/g.96948 Transcript_49174/m.96948 type:complete len:511 (+) Transcript_49174:360-1892(+)|eukprot:Cvel_18981.t1-p1 / transcript=Cvel_18981.t1 / gene=Cvel_18981 / organism=Chromera_velia_CCMP2878 / gene_product=ATP-dependent RNA helicase dbp8, putative / transcript_product=ATP-dependent RNA helicase dbp8, putative / location=Cvel_scaffold1605:10592-16220(+) / protein_length=510 / sequence_SO=supercontig / SO=protein_coding / is_pseudo=false
MEALGIAPWLVDACEKLAILDPTQIQKESIPLILQGRDLIGNSQTGSGKTACYCLPILQKLAEDPYGVFALVLLPTRELALQVSDHFAALGAPMGLVHLTITGGVESRSQATQLARRPHVVIATPGRLSEMLETPESDAKKAFKNLRFFVLDEADRLLQSTFEDDMASILDKLPSAATGRQTLLFSATLTDAIEALRDSFRSTRGNEMAVVDCSKDQVMKAPESLQHKYLFVPSRQRLGYLFSVLSNDEATKGVQGIVFVNTCGECQLLCTTLTLLGFQATPLHSLLDMRRRVASLSKFRSAVSDLLVCTDVGSRGLDIPFVGFVINFDMPREAEDYLHRVGRTARAGRQGVAVSFVTERDVPKVHKIEGSLGIRLEPLEVDEDEVVKKLNKVAKAQHKANSILSDSGFVDKVETAKEFREKARKLKDQAANGDAPKSGTSSVPSGKKKNIKSGKTGADGGAAVKKKFKSNSDKKKSGLSEQNVGGKKAKKVNKDSLTFKTGMSKEKKVL